MFDQINNEEHTCPYFWGLAGGGGECVCVWGGGASPICGPDKYVPPDKLWFVRVSNLK